METLTFSFGPFTLIRAQRALLKNGKPACLGGRAFDLLLALLERAGETVNRRQLFEQVWPDVIVAKENLRVHIAGLRKILADGQAGARYIVSVPGRGYCFVAPVRRITSPDVTSLTVTGQATSENVPIRLQRMIRRDANVVSLSARLMEKRFIGLGGPGGLGRTTVAVAMAHSLVTDFSDAMCFVDLSGIEDPAQVALTIAAALGCAVEPQDPLSDLMAYLADKELLLVLDSCEEVAEVVTDLTERLFVEAPLVHILTTSRKALRAPHARLMAG